MIREFSLGDFSYLVLASRWTLGLSLIAFIVGMASRDGTDFHLMTAGVFLTVSAVSFGCAGIVYRLDLIHEALSAKPAPTATVDEPEPWMPKALREQS